MPAGQVIGRVSVKVLPDTDDFRRRARADLEKIERTLRFEVPTTIDMSGASREALLEVKKINQRNRMLDSRKIRFYTTLDTSAAHMREQITKAIRSLEDQIRTGKRRPNLHLDVVAGTLKADLDRASLKDVEDKLKKWRDRVSPLEVHVKPNLMLGTTTWIEKRLEYLTRPRFVPIIPILSRTAGAKVLKGIGTFIAAASGARVVNDLFENLWDTFKRLDQLVPKISALTLGIGGLSAMALSSVSNLAALSVTLATIGSIALTLPGTFAGAAIGVGVLVSVFKDFNTVLPEVQGKLAALQDRMSTKFWDQAAAPIRHLINSLLPQFSSGLEMVSTKFGSFFGSLAKSLEGSLDGAVGRMFADMGTSIDIAKGAAAPLAESIRVLGEIGASYLPRFSTWLVDITSGFRDWLVEAEKSGKLGDWIDAGLANLAALGSSLSSLVGIINGIGQAALNAGGSSLAIFADTLDRIEATVNSPAFQSGLTTAFSAAHQAFANLASSAGPAVTEFFSTFSTLAASTLPMIGTAIGQLVSGIATALSNPAFVSGFQDFILGLAQAINALAPAFGPLGAAIGAIGTVLGTMLSTLGPTLAVVLGSLAGVVTSLAPALQQVVGTLGSALGSIVTSLAPLLATLAPLIGTILVQAFDALAPVIQFVVQAVGMLAPIIGQLLTAVAPLVSVLLTLVVTALKPLLDVVINLLSAALPPLVAAISALVPVIAAILGVLTTVVSFIVGLLAPVIQFVAELLIGALVGAINGVIQAFQGFVAIFMGIFNTFKGLFTGNWSLMWSGIKQFFGGVLDAIVGIFKVWWNVGILKFAGVAFKALKGVFELGWTAIRVYFLEFVGAIKGKFFEFLNGIKSAASSGLSGLRSLFSNAWNTIRSTVVDAASRIVTGVRDMIGRVVTTVRELPGKAKAALGNIASALFAAGKALIQGFINGITSAIGAVRTTLQGLTDKLKDWKGPEQTDKTLLVGAGQLVIEGFIKGLESRYSAVRKSLQGLTADMKATDFAPLPIPSMAGAYGGIDNALAGGLPSQQAPVEVNFNGNVGWDPDEVADAIAEKQQDANTITQLTTGGFV